MSEIESAVAASHPMIDMTADLVSAYVSNNPVPVAELPAVIARVHAALAGLGQGGAAETAAVEKPTPAAVRKSITHDALISFIDGKGYKTLKRHLTGNGLTIETYRERYGLPKDYPSTAASYSAQRSALAKSLGLGNQRRQHANVEPAAPVDEPPAKPKRRGRAKTETAEA